MKIVLTGGWGYGNLGDDAILSSTFSLLKEVYPDAEFYVLTYDIEDSLEHNNEGVKLLRSTHSYIDLGTSKLKFRKVNNNYIFIEKVLNKLKQKVSESSFWNNKFIYRLLASQVTSVIKSADLLVLCGGGYFNEKWISNVYSHLHELNLAVTHGVPFVVAGPTLGLFKDKKLDKKVSKCLRLAEHIYVRDDSSYQNLISNGIEAQLIPDVALTQFFKPKKSKGHLKIGIVYTNRSVKFGLYIADEIESIFIKYPNAEVSLILTRKWENDFEACKFLTAQLVRRKAKIKIIIPETHVELEDKIRDVHLLVSENLHGLILATRNGIPVIAINDYIKNSPNHRKIVAFLKQIKNSDSVIDSNSSQYLLIHKIGGLIKRKNEFEVGIEKFIAENNKNTLDFYHQVDAEARL